MNEASVNVHHGCLPLVISIPHSGTRLTPAVAAGLVPAALGVPDTDWHISRLYDMAVQMGASTVAGQYSRFVVDLNRPEDDQPLYTGATTGLYPRVLFDGSPLFKDDLTPSDAERQTYLDMIWRPYHQALRTELDRLRDSFGYALLWEAHSIRSELPMLFDGVLPDLNLGTFNGASCAPDLVERLLSICAAAPDYTHSLNGRFKGGHITRHYGRPDKHIHAVQLELTQRCYMDETPPFAYQEALAKPIQSVIGRMLEEMLTWGRAHYGR